jgi:hypothetical protein
MKFKVIYCLSFLILLLLNARLVSGQTHSLLRHVVSVKFKPGATASQIAAVDNSFQNLSKLKMVKDFEWGIVSDDHDTSGIVHVYATTFANKADEEKYGQSPEHQIHIKLGREYIEKVSALDYFVEK